MRYDIRRGTVLLVALGSLLAGCSSSDDGDRGSGKPGGKASAKGAGAPAGTPSPDGLQGGAPGGGGSGGPAGGTPVASITADTARFPGGTVEISVMSLRVRGKLALLTMRLTPHLPQGSPEKTNPYELNDRTPLDAELIDTVNLRRYVVVKDNRQRELGANDVTLPVHNEHPALATYSFAAPPAGVQSLDVHYGHWPTFRDVPVQR